VLATFAIAFAFYATLCASGVIWMDPGELTASAFELGGAHPPGHPAYTLLGKIAALIPIGEVGFRLNLLSAASMAAAIAGAVAIARKIVPEARIATALAAVLIGLSPPALTNATRAEVYAPTAALVIASLYAAVCFVRSERGAGAYLLLAALACGVAAAIHPAIALAAALPMAIAFAVAARGRWLRLLPLAALLGVLGLLCYAYLPVRANAAHEPLLFWGEPGSSSAFLALITAQPYQHNVAVAGAGERFAALFGLLGEGTGLPLLLAGLVGLVFATLTRARGAALILAVALVVVFGASLQRAFNPDMRGYILPAVLCLGIGLVVAVGAVLRILATTLTSFDGKTRSFAELAVLIPLAGVAFAGSPALADQLDDSDDAMQLWDETIGAMPPGPAVYFANSDHGLFLAQYQRIVAGARPDVAPVNAELCRDSWFLRHVKHLLPELYVPYVDDGIRGALAERLARENMRAGRPVGGEEPAFGRLESSHARPLGRAYLYLLRPGDAGPGEEARPPPRFSGPVGRRVSGFVGCVRALYEAERDRLAGAALAAGLQRLLDEHGAALEAGAREDRPPLYRFIPRETHVFIHEPWMTALVGDELRWRAGIAAPQPPASWPFERRLHTLWRALLTGALEASSPELTSLDSEAREATVRMLGSAGKDALAMDFLRATLATRPEDATAMANLASLLARGDAPAALAEAERLFARAAELEPRVAETWVRLGLVRARQGKRAEARDAWQRALALDPSRRDVAAWLEGLDEPHNR